MTPRWRKANYLFGERPILAGLILITVWASPVRSKQTTGEAQAKIEYWREWWLIKILAAKEEFREFERLEVKDSLTSLSAQTAQKEWLTHWWRGMDPDWTTEMNEWRHYVNSLVDIADARYRHTWKASRNNPPWDDRGQYFIKLGPPDAEEKATKMYDTSPHDNDGIARKMIPKHAQELVDLEQRWNAETDAVIWSWAARRGRNDKPIRVQFQMNDLLNWEAAPIVEAKQPYWAAPRAGAILGQEGGGAPVEEMPLPTPGDLIAGPAQTELVAGAEAISRAIEAAPAEYVADQRDPIPFTMERIRFHDRGDSSDLWLAYAIPLEGLAAVNGESKIKSTVTVEPEKFYPLDDSSRDARPDVRSEKVYRVQHQSSAEENLGVQVVRFGLPSGSYRVGFKIDDLYDPTQGVTGRMKVELVSYVDPSRQEKVSDPMLLARAPEPVDGSSGSFVRCLNSQCLRLMPLPSHVLDRKQDSLRIYHEAYNLVEKVNDSARVLLIYVLYKRKGDSRSKPDTLWQQVVSASSSSAWYYQAFPVDRFKKGEYFVAVETIDLYDPENVDLSKTRWAAVGFKIR